MKLKYEHRKESRFKSQMCGFEAVNCDWLWNYDKKEWVQTIDRNYGHTSHAPCKSTRAFRRMLKKAPKGVKFKLWNKYLGYCVYGYGCS